MALTDDPNDPDLNKTRPDGMNEKYLVLSEYERSLGLIRPLRFSYQHKCGTVTHLGAGIAETYARDPKFYGTTFCFGEHEHFPVEEFVWTDTDEVVGS